MDVIEAEEGKTRFFVPRQDPGHAFPPGTGRIFYNRRMELNRDATVLLTSVLNPREYLDAMGATGARGIRVASECGIPVTINDRDPEAVELIGKNAAHADLQVEVTGMNIHSLLSCRRHRSPSSCPGPPAIIAAVCSPARPPTPPPCPPAPDPLEGVGGGMPPGCCRCRHPSRSSPGGISSP